MAKKKKRLRLKKKFYFIFLILIIGIIFFINRESNVSSPKTELKKISSEIDKIYLAVNESISIDLNNEYKYVVTDPSIIDFDSGLIVGKKVGATLIEVTTKDSEGKIEVIVSDLFTIPKINNKKEYLKCEQFSDSEANTYDEILEYKLNRVGLKTRASSVEAARFLSLEFPYGIEYFYENGRLVTGGTREYVDGEGRYYHKGLFLSKSKYDSLAGNFSGPAMWGCPIYTKTLEKETPNGLDCSGFVTWALYNAGFDVGDIGAGISSALDLTDIGLKVSKNNLENVTIKPGDLIGRYGHIGMIIGIDEDNYYIAESLDTDLHVLTTKKNSLNETTWEYFILLDDLYLNDGKLTNMW